jgi:hypothetical protein
MHVQRIDGLLVEKTRCCGCREDTVAAQAQALQTKYHATKILQTERESK